VDDNDGIQFASCVWADEFLWHVEHLGNGFGDIALGNVVGVAGGNHLSLPGSVDRFGREFVYLGGLYVYYLESTRDFGRFIRYAVFVWHNDYLDDEHGVQFPGGVWVDEFLWHAEYVGNRFGDIALRSAFRIAAVDAVSLPGAIDGFVGKSFNVGRLYVHDDGRARWSSTDLFTACRRHRGQWSYQWIFDYTVHGSDRANRNSSCARHWFSELRPGPNR
jgi:hypothetical protein